MDRNRRRDRCGLLLHITHSALVQALCWAWPECPIDALTQQASLIQAIIFLLAVLGLQALSRCR